MCQFMGDLAFHFDALGFSRGNRYHDDPQVRAGMPRHPGSVSLGERSLNFRGGVVNVNIDRISVRYRDQSLDGLIPGPGGIQRGLPE